MILQHFRSVNNERFNTDKKDKHGFLWTGNTAAQEEKIALILIMFPARNYLRLIIFDFVYEPIFFIDPATPITIQVFFQRLRFSDSSFGAVSFNVFYKHIYAFNFCLEFANKYNRPMPHQTKFSSSVNLDEFMFFSLAICNCLRAALQKFHIFF